MRVSLKVLETLQVYWILKKFDVNPKEMSQKLHQIQFRATTWVNIKTCEKFRLTFSFWVLCFSHFLSKRALGLIFGFDQKHNKLIDDKRSKWTKQFFSDSALTEVCWKNGIFILDKKKYYQLDANCTFIVFSVRLFV